MIYKPKLSALEAKINKYDALMSQLSCYTYRGTYIGDAILGFGTLSVPQCGYFGFSTILPFIMGSVLANAGIPIDMELLVKLMPSKNTIQNLVTKIAIDTCILTQESIRKYLKGYGHLYFIGQGK